jgi:dipeptidase D
MTKEEIIKCKPSEVWSHFFEISQIPRCSGNEHQIICYLKEISRKNGLSYRQDEAGNICIKKQATPGMENKSGVILQGHVDMICEKNADTVHDFSSDPIKLLIQDGWLTADGTTLGADNGIAVAMALAVMESKTIEHGPMEFLLTVEEESSLKGAMELDSSILENRILINLDSEEEGIFYIGCAGGITTIGDMEIQKENIPVGHKSFQLIVTGLTGGHSGIEIHEERGNAIAIGSRILRDINLKCSVHLHNIDGGGQYNVIPREIVISFTASDSELITPIINEYKKTLENELGISEPNLSIMLVEENNIPDMVFTKELSENLINLLFSLPHGVIKMSQKMTDTVETSTNLASVSLLNGKINIVTSQRSSIESENYDIAAQVRTIMEMAGSEVYFENFYPAWEPNQDSALVRLFKDIYRRTKGREAGVKVLHGGLECGIFSHKVNNMEMISFGPKLEHVHSPSERLNISSVVSVWEFLLKVLKEI